MLKFKWKHLGVAAALVLALFLAACGGDDSEENTDDTSNTEEDTSAEGPELGQEDLELVYVEWDTEVASTHVISEVLKDEGYNVTATPIDNALMWQTVAQGDADGMVAAWLPSTHGDLYEEFGGDMVELGPNLEGAKIGLVVPEYMDAKTISDLENYAGDLDSKITGIEEGAGVVKAAQQSIEDYGLDGWEVQTSSSGAMATALGEAIDDEEPIVVTGWSPHWKFEKYDLKYLEDPEGSFGDAENIETMVRQGLEEDSPRAYQILDNFHWSEDEMNSVMLEINEGADPQEAARNWVDNNQEKVSEWTSFE
ncbi:glycine betaine/proline transport system substrate-binding protein [Salinibacillus kushneri]|uniref:Glycine betaine/proline transport system substrate-binding protein n=1 Tax=Salinibacillus kushneri TaxID=237682 RepID=A0A1I0AYW6_9BACI|nr:glycine betaine ABC transporter substrate-binding protein [Salinibacillus kushneri]SES99209.1 glycine betaine/proline transport system substrate-binding protein [Salinibacillus kushneri]